MQFGRLSVIALTRKNKVIGGVVGVGVAAALAATLVATSSSGTAAVDQAVACASPSYDGTNLTIACVVPQSTTTVTSTVTSTVTATPSSSVSPTPTPSDTTPTPTPTVTSTSNPANAGTIPGVALSTVSGNVQLSASNQTYVNKHITGSLYITGSNITVSNVKVDGVIQINMTPNGGYNSPVPAGIVLSHVAAAGVFTLGFNGLTLNAVDLSGTLNAPHMQAFCYYDSNTQITYPASNLLIENSHFHGFQSSTTDAHLENLHLGCVSGALITNNVFDATMPDSNTLGHTTASITLEAALFGLFNSNVVISNNTVIGGSYFQLYFVASGTTNAVTGNTFQSGKDSLFGSVQYPPSAYGPTQLPPGGYVKFTQSGNTLNGSPVTLPGGK